MKACSICMRCLTDTWWMLDQYLISRRCASIRLRFFFTSQSHLLEMIVWKKYWFILRWLQWRAWNMKMFGPDEIKRLKWKGQDNAAALWYYTLGFFKLARFYYASCPGKYQFILILSSRSLTRAAANNSIVRYRIFSSCARNLSHFLGFLSRWRAETAKGAYKKWSKMQYHFHRWELHRLSWVHKQIDFRSLSFNDQNLIVLKGSHTKLSFRHNYKDT